MSEIKTNIITLHMSGHASHSGYDQLAKYLDGRLFIQRKQLGFVQKGLARLFRRAERRSGSLWYNRNSLIVELDAARKWLFSRGEIFHFLYGENSYRYLGKLKKISSKNAVVCTYHTPPEKFHHVIRSPSHLRSVDAVIVVSTMQIDCFAELVGKERVFYVPHGVDTDYYIPGNIERAGRQTLHGLFVGSHLRDFETLSVATARLGKLRSDVLINVVTHERNHNYFSELENVRLFSGVSDTELLTLYQDADFFVLPLQECTANNVLLEAMACGAPIVATELQGVQDYVNKQCAVLVPKSDAAALADTIDGLCNDEQTRETMRIASRQRALEFRWEEVARQVRDVYRHVTS